jgi:Uncharacterised nucleotidyltransferase
LRAAVPALGEIRDRDRHSQPPPVLTPARGFELAQVAKLLHQTGTGALAWWRLRGTPLEHTETAEGLRHAYRIHALEAVRHAVRTVDALDRLDAAGIEALVVKGWAVARHYPEVGLRSYADLDLIVPPGRRPRPVRHWPGRLISVTSSTFTMDP